MSTATLATANTEQFEALARRRAMGEKISDQQVEQSAAESNRSIDDFDRLVGQFTHRNELRKQIGRSEAIKAELDGLEAANVSEKNAMDKALEEFHKRQQVRRQRIDEIVTAAAAAYADRSSLFATAPVAMRNRHAAAAKEVERMRVATKALAARVDSFRRVNHADVPRLEEELRQAEERVAAAMAEMRAAYDACINY